MTSSSSSGSSCIVLIYTRSYLELILNSSLLKHVKRYDLLIDCNLIVCKLRSLRASSLFGSHARFILGASSERPAPILLRPLAARAQNKSHVRPK